MKGTIIFTWRNWERLYTEGGTELGSVGTVGVHYVPGWEARILGIKVCNGKECGDVQGQGG